MAKNKFPEFPADAAEPEPDQMPVDVPAPVKYEVEPMPEPVATKEKKVLVSVREWASEQAPQVGMETASAFFSQYPTDYADPQELAKAMDAYRNRVISD